MSNTSDITPYYSAANTSSVSSDSGGSGVMSVGLGVAAACVAVPVLGAIALAGWLSEETPEDREAVNRLREEQRREVLQSCRATGELSTRPRELTSIKAVDLSGRRCDLTPVKTVDLPSKRRDLAPIKTVELNLRKLESLVGAAQKLGYRPEPMILANKPLSEQPQVLLRSVSGERMVIERNARGRLVVSTAGDELRIRSLVKQHTVDRTLEHLRSRMDMDVQTARLANGEVQIFARERTAARRGGAAEVRAQVRTDGSTWVDIDKVKGNRCEEIVSQLADAIGGEVSGTRKKDAYYQLPGEPAKTRVRV